MDRTELIKELKKLDEDICDDFESTHYDADRLLIKYINDKEIEDAYDNVGKWYS